MTDQPSSDINFNTLRLIQIVAVLDGITIGLLVLFFLNELPPSDWIIGVIAFAIGSIFYGAAFYFGCLIFVPKMNDFIIGDRTVIRGTDVDMETDVVETNDPRLNRWIGTYRFARHAFGMGILPVALLVGLYVFA